MSKRRGIWIEQTNPLRGLNPTRVVGLLEAGMRGELAELMWLYHIIEQSDPDLMALVERRASVIAEMDWNIGVAPETEDGKRNTEEAAALRAAYDRLENLQAAIAHLALASFRGFSICQLQDDVGNPAAPGVATRLACLPHWNFVRDGRAGDFKWNPEARQTTFHALPGEPLDPIRDRLLIRTVERPIDRVGLVKFVRSNFTQKAWAEYIEKVAKDGVFIIGGDSADPAKQAEYEASARNATDAGGGYLPPGFQVQFANMSRGLAPFEAHMRFLREQLVMAGTGGMLTMIASPTGIGQGASDAHADTFKAIARKEAREISEVFQRFFDLPLLRERFPNEPVQAWFELAYREETDLDKLVAQGVQLAQVFDLDAEQWSEKTGLQLAKKIAPPAAPMGFALNAASRMRGTEGGRRKTENRWEGANRTLVSEAVAATLGIEEAALQGFFSELDARLQKEGALSPDQLLDRVEALVDALPEIAGDRPVQEIAGAIEGLLGTGVANQLAAASTEDGRRKTENRGEGA